MDQKQLGNIIKSLQENSGSGNNDPIEITQSEQTRIYADQLEYQYDHINGLDDITEQLIAINETLKEKFSNFVTTFEKDKLQQIETKREESADREKLVNAITSLKTKQQKEDEKPDDYLTDLFAAIGPLFSSAAGIVAGIVMSPFTVIKNFFAALSKQVAGLNKLLSGGLGRFFAPITNFFNTIRQSKVIQGLAKAWNGVKAFFAKIGQFFGLIDEAGKATGALGKILGVASKIGSALGRLFIPITILIGAISAVTGFIKGYEGDQSFVGRIKGALVGVFDGLVGSIVRMLGNIVGGAFSLIGLDTFGDAIKEGVGQAVDGIVSTITGLLDLIKGIFTFDFGLIGSSFMDLASGILKAVLLPVELIWGAIKQVLSFFGLNIDLSVFDMIAKGFELLFLPFKQIGNAIMSVVGVFSSIGSKILDTASSLGESIANIEMPSMLDLIMAPFNILTNARDYLLDKLMNTSAGQTLGRIAAGASDMLKALLRTVLPDPSTKREGVLGWAKSLAVSAIPDGVYEFAGLNPDTGDRLDVDTKGMEPIPSTGTTELAAATSERRALADQQGSSSATSSPVVANSGNTSVVNNNSSTQVVQPRPQPSRKPNSAEDLYFGSRAASVMP